MPIKIKALILEDTEDDLVLLLLHLQKNFDVKYQCIQTEAEYRDALEQSTWDIILSDYSMPNFDGLKALEIKQEKNKELPFILITGAIGEELAVKVMRSGASDYFIKGNLQRLNPSIEKELKDAKRRKRYKSIENQRRRLLKVVRQSLNEIYIFNGNTLRFEYANETALKNLGYTLGELKKLTPVDLKKEFDPDTFNSILEPLIEKEVQKIVLNTHHTRKNGTRYPLEMHIQQIQDATQTSFVAVGLDMTLRDESAKIIKKQKIEAKELELTSRHKSEFLANMSHELRTPLNSIILLSKLLSDNRFENLNDDQIDYLSVIYKSGNKLLELINDVLDLSKIEAGEISFYIGEVVIDQIFKSLIKSFEAVAFEKGIQFIKIFDLKNNYSIKSDPLRLEQVLANFLSNAFKFTVEGTVEFRVYNPTGTERKSLSLEEQEIVAFSVKDSGIGIEKNKREEIFEAFRQADSSDKRSFGGSGLGLSISKEISDLLGGEIKLKSRLNRGSTFTLYLPTDSSLFISDKKYRTIGEKKAVSIQRKISADDAEAIKNHKILGRTVRARENIVSASILLVDDSDIHVSALKELIENDRITCLTANTARDTYKILENSHIDLLVLDLGLPDEDGFDVINKIKSTPDHRDLPIIIYSGRTLTDSQKQEYEPLVHSMILKSSGSYQQLMDEINHILTLDSDSLNISPEPIDHQFLSGKKLMIVDDDQRNIFSLSQAMESFNMNIITAQNGREALEILHQTGDFDAILMDMMMPVMNGYDAMREIRKEQKWKDLPIIAITARAMPEDKKQCIEAGASDYLSKPIDIDHLVQTLKVWLLDNLRHSDD